MGSQRAFRHSETQLVSKGVTGFTPLRDYAATYIAPDRAFPNYETPAVMDVLIQAQERVISVERIIDRPIETPIAVPKESIVEKIVERPKIVEKAILQEKPVIQYVDRKVQLVREVPVDRVVEKQYVRKVIVERIIEKVVEVIKDVPVERIIEKTVEIIKRVPVEKVIERIQIKEVPVVQTEERVVEMVKEIPVEIIKEVPVYIKVDPIEWEARHGLKAGVAVQSTVHMSSSASMSAGGSIGMLLAVVGGGVTVVELVAGLPAAACGLISVNDVLLAVDGTVVEGWALPQVFSKIHGPAGSTVTLQFRSAADGRTFTATLTRAGTGSSAMATGSTVRTTWNRQPTSLKVEYAGFDNRPGTEGRYDPADQTSRAYL